MQTINLAGHASKGMLPISGGLAEQSAWFVDVMMTLENDQATIDRERIERERNRSSNVRY